jgi:hypothetical protein
MISFPCVTLLMKCDGGEREIRVSIMVPLQVFVCSLQFRWLLVVDESNWSMCIFFLLLVFYPVILLLLFFSFFALLLLFMIFCLVLFEEVESY